MIRLTEAGLQLTLLVAGGGAANSFCVLTKVDRGCAGAVALLGGAGWGKPSAVARVGGGWYRLEKSPTENVKTCVPINADAAAADGCWLEMEPH